MTESRRRERSSLKFVQSHAGSGLQVVRQHQGASQTGILYRGAASAIPTGSATCGGCHGCGPRVAGNPGVVRLTGKAGERIELDLPVAVRYEVLWNSWLKPLVAVLVTATLSSLLGVPDGLALVLAIGSMALGIMLCRPLPVTALTIRKMT